MNSFVVHSDAVFLGVTLLYSANPVKICGPVCDGILFKTKKIFVPAILLPQVLLYKTVKAVIYCCVYLIKQNRPKMNRKSGKIPFYTDFPS